MMSALHANTFINVLRNTMDLRLGVISENNMGKNQETLNFHKIQDQDLVEMPE